MGVNVKDYVERNKQPGILIAYTKDGSIMFVEFGYEGYLIHFEDEKATITKNGKFTDGPK